VAYEKLIKGNKKMEPDLALSLHYMADILADTGQIQKALYYNKKELEIAKALYSKNRKHLNVLVHGLNGTAVRYANTGKANKSMALLNQSLKAQKSTFKSKKEILKNYPNLSWTYNIMAMVYLKKGKIGKAIPYLETSLKMRKEIAKRNTRYLGALKYTLTRLGEAYSRKGNKNKAKSYYKGALAILNSKTYKKQVINSIISSESKRLTKQISKL